jgi:hypothetical protein
MSAPRRYELSDFEWSIIQPLLPNKPRGVHRSDDRKVLNRIYLASADWVALGGHPRSLRAGDHLCEPLPALGEDRRVGPPLRGRVTAICRWSTPPLSGSSARRERQEGGAQDTPAAARDEARGECMGRSRGGGMRIRIYWASGCGACSIRKHCTTGKDRRGRRWELRPFYGSSSR